MPRPSVETTRRAELAQRRTQERTQRVLLVSVIAIVSVLVVAIAAALMKGGRSREEALTDGLSAGAAAANPEKPAASGASGTAQSDPLRARVDELLLAIQEGDRDVLARSVNFPRWNDARFAQGQAEKRWAELDSLAQTLSRQKICESIVADEPTRDFLRQSRIRSYVVKSQDESSAQVLVIHQHLIETRREQERNLDLAKLDGAWYLVGVTTSPIQTPDDIMAARDAVRAADRARRASRDLAPIERQELPLDTPADVRVRIEAACAKLTDLSATKEATKAKRELVEIGKPAIPAVLNLIVGREELATKEDQMIVNHAVSVLKDITQEDLGYAPGGIGGTMTGDIKAENVQALMRWFGWWRDHRKTWTGPKQRDADKDG
jgi:hypothetical protein